MPEIIPDSIAASDPHRVEYGWADGGASVLLRIEFDNGKEVAFWVNRNDPQYVQTFVGGYAKEECTAEFWSMIAGIVAKNILNTIIGTMPPVPPAMKH